MSLFSGMLAEVRAIRFELVECLHLKEQLTKGFNDMSEKADKVKADLAGAKADVEEIKGDFSELLDKIASFSGLPTVEEWEEIQTQAAELKAATRDAADVVPEAEA